MIFCVVITFVFVIAMIYIFDWYINFFINVLNIDINTFFDFLNRFAKIEGNM